MSKEKKIISLVIVAIALVAVLSFSLSTLMTSGKKLQGAINAVNALPSTEGTTTYKDWTNLTPIDNEYSYSTLIYTDKTRFYANISNPNHNYGLKLATSYYRVEDQLTPSISLWSPEDKGQLIITDCGYDKDGTPLSAVIEFSISASYRNPLAFNVHQNEDPEQGEVGAIGYNDPTTGKFVVAEASSTLSVSRIQLQNINNEGKVIFTNIPADGNAYAVQEKVVNYNMPLAFNLGTSGGSTDVKITYYRKLTLKNKSVVNGANYAEVDTTKSEIAKDITKVNSAYNDLDTSPVSFANPQAHIDGADSAGMLYGAHEGMKPLNGTTTLFYNKTGKHTLTPSDYENTCINQADKRTMDFRMTERANGIFINPDFSKEDVLRGKWDYILNTFRDQGKTRKQALDHYCKYMAKCTETYDSSINVADDTTATDAARKAARTKTNRVVSSSVKYFETAGFSYLTSAQLLTEGVAGEFSFRYEMPGGGIKFGFLSPQEYQFGDPVKSVSSKTIKVGEVGYFNVSQPIPNNNVTDSVGFYKKYPNVFSSDYHLKSIKFEDEVDPRLTVVKEGITVMTESGIDITQYFDIVLDANNKVTATSNASTAEFFDSYAAYGTKYILSIQFMYLGPVNKFIEIPNKAKVTYKVGTKNPETKQTNEVIITIGENPVKLTYDCTTNGGSPEFNPITVDQVPGTSVDLTKICKKTGNKFLGFAENATDTTAMTEFTMPDHDTTIYGLYTPSTCDTLLKSNVYKVDETNKTISIPMDDSDDTILKNVSSTGEISISGNNIIVKCDGQEQPYKINRYWISKTGNDVIKWTAIISGTLLLAVIAVFIKIKSDKKKN